MYAIVRSGGRQHKVAVGDILEIDKVEVKAGDSVALTPLLLAADAPGKEILHPVAVVIFGGLVSSTLLDTVLTPLLFWLLGRRPLDKLLQMEQTDGF